MPRVPGSEFLFRHGFLLGLAAAVLFAFLAPEWGAEEGPLRAGLVAKAGVFVIFLLQGLSLRTREMIRGFGNFRLHLLVQCWIFLVGGGILAGTGLLLRATALAPLADGFLYLALLPTTISSAIAFTTTAQGNVAGAIVNTTFANLFGVFWVPAGCLLFFAAGSGYPVDALGPLLIKLAQLILLPLLCGQLLRPLIKETSTFHRLRPGFRIIQNGVIVFIVFGSFARSVLAETWSGISPGLLAGLVGLVVLAMLAIHGLVWAVSGKLLDRHEDRITALFCGAQRTLATGAPMAVAIFGDATTPGGPELGILLLPLLCYHPLQLFLAGLLLPHLRKSAESAGG